MAKQTEKISDKSIVKLRIKGEKETRNFTIAHANNILGLKNAQWEIADEKFEFNGTEISKK